MENNKNGETLDLNFKYEVAEKPGGETVKACYSCGVCTASCPVNEVHEDFNPRRLIRKILLGERESLLSSDLIWYCVLCERCYANCPQKVNFAHITRAIRKIAVEQGYVENSFRELIEKIDTTVAELRKNLISEAIKEKDSKDININEILKTIINSDK